MTDNDYYDGLALELLGRWNRLRSFTSHSPSIGFHHEEILRATIRELISPRFQLRSGFTFASRDLVSRQGDILVVDEGDPAPYLFREGDLVVAHPRAVACVIEVKTYLSKREFVGAIENLASFQAVADAASPRRRPATYVFAFNSPAFSKARLGDWYQAVRVPDEVKQYPRGVLSLQRGLLYLRPHQASGRYGHHFVCGEEARRTKPKSLSCFLASIRKQVEMQAGVESNPYDFAELAGLSWSAQALYFGSGATP